MPTSAVALDIKPAGACPSAGYNAVSRPIWSCEAMQTARTMTETDTRSTR
jgi:hypothetical protein